MNIDFSNLSKEQKQYIVLGIIGVGAIGYGLYFGISKFGGALSDTKTQLTELNDKIDRAERELGRRARTMTDFDQTITVLESHFDNLPPEENYYSWATEIVYAKGRNAGLQVESVDEIGADTRQVKKLKDPVYFETYSLRITARGGYAETKAFIRDIEDNHPLVRFTGVEISRGNDPEKHSVQLFVQWPHKLQRIAALWKDQRRRPSAAMVAKAEPKSETQPAAVVTPEPKPVPVVAKVEPKPELKKPAVEQVTKPKTAPKPVEQVAPVVVKKPTPPPVKPAPVVAKTEPKPAPKPVPVKAEPQVAEPAPVVEKPKPVLAETKPEPKPVAKPATVVAPEPVVAEKKPEPKPVVEPAPVVVDTKPEPKVAEPVKPAPVMVKAPEPVVEPASEPQPAPVVVEAKPVKEEDHSSSILASIDLVEGGDAEKDEAAPKVENEMASLLASLDSNGTAAQNEPVSDTPSSDADDLENYITQLAAQSETAAPVEPVVEAEAVMVEAPVAEAVHADIPVTYASTSKSAKILEDLLTKGKPKASKSLGSFLDGMVGDINESR